MDRLSRAHERYRQTDIRQTDRQTDGRAIAYSEREREFTFARKRLNQSRCRFGCELEWTKESFIRRSSDPAIGTGNFDGKGRPIVKYRDALP